MTAILHRTAQRARLCLVGLSVLGLVSLADAALVEVKQESLPVGHASKTEVVETGTTYQTIQPNLTSNGYVFGYWKTGNTRLADAGGRSVTQATVTVDAAMTITAHYFLATQDSDSDGVMDWYEYRNFGSLSQTSSDDADGDGFDNGQENALGQEATIKDQVEDGGISSRTSSGFVFADTSMVHYVIKSDPIGFITSSEGYVEVNATVSTSNLHGPTNGYHFAYWTVNGARIAGPTGVAMSQVSAKLTGETAIIAHYVPSGEDADSDSVMDWYELNQFGNLSSGPGSDDDGDGFTNEQESELGQEATIKDQVEDGGISSRTSSGFVFADTSMVHYVIKSEPIGFISTSEGYVEVNATVSTSNLHGPTNGYHFGYWTVNGTRIAGPTGVAMSQVSAKLTGETAIVAHYFPSGEDSDNDGVMDWYELNQFGNLSGGPSNDSDGDGFTNEQENELGQEATIKDQVEDGGISSRSSGGVLYFMQVNKAPDGLDLNASTTIAGKPAGRNVGTFTPHDDDDANAIGNYDLSLVDGNGSTDNAKFAIAGRILMTNATLAVGNYSIRVRVADDENASFQKAFSIQAVPDPNKDDDNDTLTYAQEQAAGTSDNNPDSDGDGFGDALEVNLGTNPADANSKPNQVPTAIDLNGSSVVENLPVGTAVGKFTVTDPDANSSHQLSFVEGNGSTHNHLFSIDANHTLKTTVTFDFESNASTYSIRVRAKDEHNASLEKVFAVGLTNANETPFDLNATAPLSVAENLPIGTKVGEMNATDPDANSTLTYTLVGGANDNHLFTIDANGTLRTAAILDHESNATLSIRAQVADDHNASLQEVFLVSVINVVEDLDGDGIEDHADSDDDGDGFSDAVEIAYGSDPRNAQSVANKAPTAIDLNGTSLPENSPIGSLVGTLNATDPDANSALTLTFAEGNGSQHNNLFTIDANGTLRTAATLDYESNDTILQVRVEATDEHNASLAKAFVISLLNVNEPPDDLNSTAPFSIAENQPIGTIAGEFNATDPDADTNFTYTLVGDSNDNHLFTIDANGTLRTAALFDYETNATFTIRVKVRDQYNAWIKENFTVIVTNVVEDLDGDGIEDHSDPDDDGDGFTDAEELAAGSDPRDPNSIVNRAPTDFTLSHARIAEGRPVGDFVGRVRVSDPDDPNATGSYGYALVDGNGSAGNAFFSLDANGALRAAVVPDYETNATHAVRIRVTDEWNASLEKSLVIEVVDLAERNATPTNVPAPELPAWLAGAQAAGPTAPNWFTSPWFDSFHLTPTPWIYHAELGWLYTVPDGAGDVWLWREGQGWLWTGEDIYPWFFRHESTGWLYYLKTVSGKAYFYNQASGEVE